MNLPAKAIYKEYYCSNDDDQYNDENNHIYSNICSRRSWTGVFKINYNNKGLEVQIIQINSINYPKYSN